MPSHPRVEEVEDSEVDMASDPSEADMDELGATEILRHVDGAQQQQRQTRGPLGPSSQMADVQSRRLQEAAAAGGNRDVGKTYHCLYPLYLDASRTRGQGRRVPGKLAVSNPLAWDMQRACVALGLHCMHEADKTHPRDWSNPGRVRVESPLADPATGKARNKAGIRTKRALLAAVARLLQQKPATEQSAGASGEARPLSEEMKAEQCKRPAVPKGKAWKINDLLPCYSRAMPNGMDEKTLEAMLKTMALGGGGGMPGMAGGAAMPRDMSQLAAMWSTFGGAGKERKAKGREG